VRAEQRRTSAYVVREPVILDAVYILFHHSYIVVAEIRVVWLKLYHVSTSSCREEGLMIAKG